MAFPRVNRSTSVVAVDPAPGALLEILGVALAIGPDRVRVVKF